MSNRLSLVLILLVSFAQPAWAGDIAEAKGDPESGKTLFESDLGCHVCHGAEATGSIGPNIRETITIEMVYHALQNFPDMMNWQYNNPELFEDQNLLDIISYLQTLPRELEAE
jgi:cytochrome c553